jgi:hypothetical protein
MTEDDQRWKEVRNKTQNEKYMKKEGINRKEKREVTMKNKK